MTPDQKTKLEQMFRWAINKMFDEPDGHEHIEMCWNDVRKCAANAWEHITGIDVR